MKNFSLLPNSFLVVYALLMIAALALTGCSPTPEPATQKDAQELVDSMTYVKAKNGACFAVMQTGRLNSSITYSESVSVTQVDCDLIPKGQ